MIVIGYGPSLILRFLTMNYLSKMVGYLYRRSAEQHYDKYKSKQLMRNILIPSLVTLYGLTRWLYCASTIDISPEEYWDRFWDVEIESKESLPSCSNFLCEFPCSENMWGKYADSKERIENSSSLCFGLFDIMPLCLNYTLLYRLCGLTLWSFVVTNTRNMCMVWRLINITFHESVWV